MKKHALTILGMASLFFVLGASATPATSIELWANIPFEFMAGDQMLPAGTYDVTHLGDAHPVLRIQNQNGDHGGAIVRASISQPANTGRTTRLVFQRYGDRYFLSQIWTARRSGGYVLLKSNRELEIARELAAKGTPAPEVVSVAASVP